MLTYPIFISRFRKFCCLKATALLLGATISPYVSSENESLPSLSSLDNDRPIKYATFIENEKRPQRQPINKMGEEKSTTAWALYIDNDAFTPQSDDRDYTGGLSLTLSGAATKDMWLSVDPVLAHINNWFGWDTSDIKLHSFEAGANSFTPEDINPERPLQDDRPYASLIYLSNSQQRVFPQQKRSLMTTLTLGVLGLNLVGNVQNKFHNAAGIGKANGWNNQISHGGEPTFRYSVSSQKLALSRYGERGIGTELQTSLKGSVGYLTNLSIGVSGRWGKINSPWWTFNPQANDYAEKSTPLSRGLSSGVKKEFYLWAGANVHLRLYNALLQGQFRNSKVTYSYDELYPVVAEGWLGITKEFNRGLRCSYVIRGQTAEIKRGSASRNTLWGGFIFSRTF